MTSSNVIPDEPFMSPAKSVVVTDHQLTVCWADGRTLSVPLAWYPRLVHGTAAERSNVEIDAFGLHWPDLDDDISYKGLLLGWKSGESAKSLRRWLDYRSRGEKVPVPEVPMPARLAKLVDRKKHKPRSAARVTPSRTAAIPKRRTA